MAAAAGRPGTEELAEVEHEQASLTAAGRRARLAAVAVAVALLLAGTFWGDDDHFPFGPFRMYSVANELDGEVATVTFVATTSRHDRIEIGPEEFGLRPAEIEGQLPRLLQEPRALEGLVQAYEHLNTDPEDILVLRLVEEISILENGRPVATERKVLASWGPG